MTFSGSTSGSASRNFRLQFMNVGNADCIYIEDHQKKILIDCGRTKNKDDVKALLSEIQGNYDGSVELDLVIGSHPDSDHIGGIKKLLDDPEIWVKSLVLLNSLVDLKVWESESKLIPVGESASDVRKIEVLCKKKGIDKLQKLKSGQFIPGTALKLLGPEEGVVKKWLSGAMPDRTHLFEGSVLGMERMTEGSGRLGDRQDTSPSNACSLILLYEPVPGLQFLLPGDSTRPELEKALKKYRVARPVLKAPHHAGDANLTPTLLRVINPRAAIISAAWDVDIENKAAPQELSHFGPVYLTAPVTESASAAYNTEGVVFRFSDLTAVDKAVVPVNARSHLLLRKQES